MTRSALERCVVLVPAHGGLEVAEAPGSGRAWRAWLRTTLGGNPRSLPVKNLWPPGFDPVLIVNGELPHRTSETPSPVASTRLPDDLNSIATALHCTHAQCFLGTGAIIGTAVLAQQAKGGGAPLRRTDAEALFERLQ
jgi:hypothetical protein